VPGELQTRRERGRAVIGNALTKPVNVLVPAGLVVAGLLLGWFWILLALAIVVYAMLVATTAFDAAEAKRVLSRGRAPELSAPREISTEGLPPEIAQPLQAALVEEVKIEQAIAEAQLPYAEVSAEVNVLVGELERIARKGAVIHAYLADPDVAGAAQRLETLRARAEKSGPAAEAQQMALEALEAQVRIQDELDDQFTRSCAELEHLAASLGVIRGQIVRMSVAEDASVQDDVADQVRNLRERMTLVAEGLTEATSQLGPTAAG
jgi:hypothetical protein